MYYVHKTSEEFKDRNKKSILEGALQKVLQDNKQTDQEKFQEKLDAIENMPDSVRKVIQEEIDGCTGKSEYDTAKKVSYLKHVFRLPWDETVDPYWDMTYSAEVLERSHYGMSETKERILEFVAKNKRVNSQKGMVLLLTGPPGVGKTSIAIRYSKDDFNLNQESTLGAAYVEKIHKLNEDKASKFQIWDTAGQEKFQSITQSYYKNSDACIAMFDITN